MTVTVCCLAGLGSPRMKDDHLSAQLFRLPYSRRDLLYGNSRATLATATEGAEKAFDAANKSKGPIILAGQSHGARALCLLLRSNPALDPDKVVVVLTGNPERKYGGIMAIPNSGWAPNFGGPGVPDDTPFRVFDVANQYAFWEDSPNVLPNTTAVLNSIAGMSLHEDYSQTKIGDPRNVVHVEGNRTYILRPTFPMPSKRNRWWSVEREALEHNKALAAVEKGYTRPFVVPPQTIKWYPNGGGYNVATRWFVKAPATPVWDPFT